MMRVTKWVGLFLALAGFVAGTGNNAKADLVFSFSITNTVGNVAGTVTGEIFGLGDNGTFAATKVLIESIPPALSNYSTPIDAVLWNTQNVNSFTTVNGQVVSGGFHADNSANGLDRLYVNAATAFNFVSLGSDDTTFVWGDNGLAAANITPEVSSVPEPGPLASAGVAGLFGLGLAWRRRSASA